jgi:crotonobetainyl-CoA:carnitine CoA-transferase CaiB-like acyl-CoA transferase
MVAALTGLVSRNATGHGCYVDISMMDTQVAMLGVAAQRYFALGEVPARMGSEHLGRVPSGALPCGDGKWVQITTGDNQWPDLCKVLDIAEWGRREEVATNDARLAHRAEVMDKLRQEMSKYRRDELVARCSAAGVPIGPINELDDVLNDEHVRARGVVQEFDHPTVGKFPGLAVPLKFRDVDQPQFGRPPLLGEHTEEVLRHFLGYDAARIAALREAGAI